METRSVLVLLFCCIILHSRGKRSIEKWIILEELFSIIYQKISLTSTVFLICKGRVLKVKRQTHDILCNTWSKLNFHWCIYGNILLLILRFFSIRTLLDVNMRNVLNRLSQLAVGSGVFIVNVSNVILVFFSLTLKILQTFF